MTPLELALHYAVDLGLLVVPASAKTKSSLVLNWTNDAERVVSKTDLEKRAHMLPPGAQLGDPVPFGSSRDEAQVREWWKRFPRRWLASAPAK